MPRNEILVEAPVECVWEVLADPLLYSEWVSGVADTRHGQGNWPEPGSSLEYRLGAGPFRIGDETVVIESEPGRRLLVRARAGRVATVRVEIGLEACDGATTVRIDEDVSGGAAGILPDLITDLLFKSRNIWSLERLRDLAERQVTAPIVEETAPAAP
jgi:uncharacterized protein YndB with AHSA1/START domain